MSNDGLMMNLSFHAHDYLVSAFRDMVAQAVRQAGGEDARARECGEQAAALVTSAVDPQSNAKPIAVVVRLGPPIQVIVGGQTLTLDIA